MKATVLVIDDELRLRQLLARILSLEDYVVLEASDARSGLWQLAQTDINVVISDVKLPDENGIALTARIKQRYPATEVIVLTAYGTIADGVEAMKNGAFDYLIKGDDNNKLIPLVSRAVEKARLQLRIQQLEAKVQSQYSFDRILGRSPAIQQAVDLARKVAATDTTVLLAGETGTGKEIFAQAIHGSSPRRLESFVAINCGALSKDILESELFGHRAGSFTGANTDQKGLFAEADKGTLFLDEIGEMPLDLQAKLLRVLETHDYIRVGDTRPTRVDVRIIAATNRSLLEEAIQGRFRLDLYYRLSVFSIQLPALRERPDDIPALATEFARQYANKSSKRTIRLSPAFVARLQRHPWKGNIRELRNVIERAVIMADGPELLPEHLPFDLLTDHADPNKRLFDLTRVEKQHIIHVLRATDGNKIKAAHLLGIGLTTLYRKIHQYALENNG